MKLNKVTLNGIAKVPISEVKSLQEEFPFVEFGVLISKDRAGQHPRYPTPLYVKMLAASGLNLSAHLCGQDAILFITGYSKFLDDYPFFNRVQINIDYSKAKMPGMAAFNAMMVLKQMGMIYPNKKFIIQFNSKNVDFIYQYLYFQMYPENIEVLYDESLGMAKEIKFIETPFLYNTGYAGGINAGNIDTVVTKIINHPSDQKVWIDMESGVMDENDTFSVAKAREILRKTEKYISL